MFVRALISKGPVTGHRGRFLSHDADNDEREDCRVRFRFVDLLLDATGRAVQTVGSALRQLSGRIRTAAEEAHQTDMALRHKIGDPFSGVDPARALRVTEGIDGSVGRLGGRIAKDSIVLDRGAMAAAFGLGLSPGTSRLVLSVPEGAYRFLRGQPGWSEHQSADGGPRLANGDYIVGMGWTRGPSHTDLLGRAWRTPAGTRVAGLPDVYAMMQERGAVQDLRDTALIRAWLGDPRRPPLPEHVIARQIAAVRSAMPDGLLRHADAPVATRLAANGMHTVCTLYGDPGVGRANQIIGDLELAEYRVMATYHNGFGMVEDLRDLQQHMRNVGAGPGVTLDAVAADAYSDAVYGHGRRRDNPTGYDELRSADLLREHALTLGYDPARAQRLHQAVLGTGFDEATKAQAGKHHPDILVQAVAGVDLHTLARPDNLLGAFDIALEDGISARHSPDRLLGRTFIENGIHIRTTRQGVAAVDEYADWRSNISSADRTAMDWLARRISGNGSFSDPVTGHQYPETWTLDNPALRAEHAAKSRELGGQLLDRNMTGLEAYEEAGRHAARMREKYQ
ncbi:hypothetical protein [Nocardia brasiliensis]|uniref:hypothetical protein n=1 Tax=Nocardia brasiliensis TaxID=37326 RepID=UPI003D8A37D3